MSLQLSNESTMIPCHGCSDDIIVPAGPVRAAVRANRSYIAFCSARCQRKFIAIEGGKQQDEALHARRDHSDSDAPVGGS
jgi:endogenous inhibitor of DNA gyrase (YacG/DUF329 family)